MIFTTKRPYKNKLLTVTLLYKIYGTFTSVLRRIASTADALLFPYQ